MFKILTKNGIENTNIDGARANRLLTGGKSGVVSGAFNENTLLTLTSKSITVNTCELIIAGHRIVLTSPETVTVSNTPASQQVLSLVAQLDVSADSTPSFSLILQTASTPLTTDNMFQTASGSGRYQIELAQVTQQVTGALANLVRTVKTIEGGGGGGDITIEGGAYITVGEVTVTTIQGDTPTVHIENTIDDEGKPKTDFHFGFPSQTAGSVTQEDLNQVKSSAVGAPVLSGQDLTFSNLYGQELAKITLPSNAEGSGFSHLPLQIIGYNGTDYNYEFILQETASGVYSARLWFNLSGIICSYGGNVFKSIPCTNWSSLVDTPSDLTVSIATIPIHDTSQEIPGDSYATYSYMAQGVEARFDKTAGKLSVQTLSDNYSYYIPAHSWYIEFELDKTLKKVIIKAYQCNNY